MNRISAERDPELTNDTIGGCTKCLFAKYKNNIIQAVKMYYKNVYWRQYEIPFLTMS